RRGAGHAAVEVEDAPQVAELLVEAPDQPTDQRVGFATLHHQRGDQRRARAHQVLGRIDGDPAPFGHGVVLLPVLGEARVVVDVGQFEVHALAQAQAELLDAGVDDVGPADQDRPRQALVDHGLHRTQYHRLLALGVDHPLAVAARAVVDRLHYQPGAMDEL